MSTTASPASDSEASLPGVKVLVNGRMQVVDVHDSGRLPWLDQTREAISQPRLRLLKRGFDLLFSFLLVVLLAPLICLCAIIIRLTTQGPAFFSQLRIGRLGQVFYTYKLRTMYTNAEVTTGAVWCTVGSDHRVTKVGRVLRKAGIDSLPQLCNIIRGDMSLIGPRAERPEFFELISREYPDYLPYISTLQPGMLGLGNLCFLLSPDHGYLPYPRVQLDLYYAKHATMWLDCKIAVSYVLVFLGMRHIAGRLLRLEIQLALSERSSFCDAVDLDLMQTAMRLGAFGDFRESSQTKTTTDMVLFVTLIISMCAAVLACSLVRSFATFPVISGSLLGMHAASWLFVEGLMSRRSGVSKTAAFMAGFVILWEVVIMLFIVQG